MRPAALVAPPIMRAELPEGETINKRLNDAQMAAVMSAIIQTQIGQANVARGKTESNRVAEFAVAMIPPRRAIARDLEAFTKKLPEGAENSELLARVHDDAQSVTGSMVTLTAVAFDGAYIGGQISEFQHALVLLDTRIPDVQSPELRSIATHLRNTLVKNLAEARALRTALVGAGGR